MVYKIIIKNEVKKTWAKYACPQGLVKTYDETIGIATLYGIRHH
jgi:hypothetical protein